MKDPHNKSSKESTPPASSLFERLAERGSGKPGVVDTNHPRALYGQTTGWIADRFPLLAHLKNRYGSGDAGYQQKQPLPMGQAFVAAEDGALGFAHAAPPSALISGGGEDSVSQSKSSNPSPAPPVTYRVSRRPAHQKIDRATRGLDMPAKSAGVEPDNSFNESGPLHSVAPPTDTSLPRRGQQIAAGDAESEEPTGRLKTRTVNTGPSGSPASTGSGASKISPRGSLAVETPSYAHEQEPAVFPPQDQTGQAVTAIVHKQHDLILLKMDNASPLQEDRAAPPTSETGISSTRALGIRTEPRAMASDRQSRRSTAPIALNSGGSAAPSELRDKKAGFIEAGQDSMGIASETTGAITTVASADVTQLKRHNLSTDANVPGRQSASGDLVLARSQAAPMEPSRQKLAALQTGVASESKPDEGANRDLLVTQQAHSPTRAPDTSDVSEVMGDTVEAGPAAIQSRLAGFDAGTTGREIAADSGGPLILRKTRIDAAEFAASKEAPHSNDMKLIARLAPYSAAVEAHERQPAARPSAKGKSGRIAPGASSPDAVHAAVPAFGTDSGSVVAREIREASRRIETPNIIWRQSASPPVGQSLGADTPMTLNASRSTSATSADRSSSGSQNTGQSWTAQEPEANQSPSIDVGRITEQIIHAIRRRLEVERERRGTGR